MSGTAHDKWSGIIKGFPHCFCRYMTHDVRHGGLYLADGSPVSLKITAAVFINQTVIFAVIVPHRAGSHLQDRLFQHILPYCSGSRFRKVYEHTLSAPPGADSRFISLTVPYKNILLLHFCKLRMGQQDSGFYIGRYGYSTLCHF